ncbi:MAG TPA: hypothetical protein VFW66_03010 [Gemmatimonadales bacterium]|nr:hypothetical protein [Gemmatimonadales bacterium]
MPWSRGGRAAREPASRMLLGLLGAAVLTCGAAAYNRFPLTYYDTASYLRKAHVFTHAEGPRGLDVEQYVRTPLPATSPFRNPFFYRPVTYTLFLLPFSFPATLYAVPLAQGLIVAFSVLLALRAAGLASSATELVLLFLGLSLFTSLPWYSGQLMPDLFSAVMVLLLYALLSGWDRLARWERIAAWLLLAGAIAAHLSNVPLYAALAVTAALGVRLLRGRWPCARRLALSVAGPFALAVSALAGSNYLFCGKLVLSESSDLFYLARLVGDGTAQRYLAEACPAAGYLLCDDRANLPADSDYFLWSPTGPWSAHQNDPRFLAEAPEIIRGTLRAHGAQELAAAARNTVHQLGMFGADLDLLRSDSLVRPVIVRFGETTAAAYARSRQVTGGLPLRAVGAVQVTVVWLSLAALLLALPALRRRRDDRVLLFAGVIAAAVVLNALVFGALSALHDRYEARVIWLVPLAAWVAVRALPGRRELDPGPVCASAQPALRSLATAPTAPTSHAAPTPA